PRRRSRDAARLGARGPAPRDARGQRLGGVPRSRGRRAAVDAASHRGAAVRQRWLRREGRGAARGAARGDSCREGGRRHRPRRVHFLAERPMTATTTTLNGPVSRIDPATAYRRPASVPGLLRLDSNEGVLPSPALLGDLANADPELLRRYPDVSALEAALAARVGVAPERLLVTAGADEGIDPARRAYRPAHPRSRVCRVRGPRSHTRGTRSSQRPGAADALQGLGPRRLPGRLRGREPVRRRRAARGWWPLYGGGALGCVGAVPAGARGRAAPRTRRAGARGAPPAHCAACRRRPPATALAGELRARRMRTARPIDPRGTRRPRRPGARLP